MAAPMKFNLDDLCIAFNYKNRFYTSILYKLNRVPNPKIKTCGVGFTEQGKLALHYNEEYFLKWNFSESCDLLEHEILHIALSHLTRLPKIPGDKYNDLKNIACDIAIDQFLPNVPDRIPPEKFNLPPDESAEFYFMELVKQQQKQQQQQQQQKSQGQAGQPQDGEGDGEPEESDKGTHELWGQVVDAKTGELRDITEEEVGNFEHEVEQLVMQAASECSADEMGKLPSCIKRELQKLQNPVKKVDWKKQLKRFVNTVTSVEKTPSQKRVDRRLIELVDYIMPGKKRSRRPILLAARDTSGSVFNDETQAQYLNEILYFSKFCDVWLVDCDTKVQDFYRLKKKGDIRPYLGGGGTAFEPVFELAKKLQVDGIIYLTDTHGSFPSERSAGKFASNTIWVTVDQETVNVPFGKHVNIKNT